MTKHEKRLSEVLYRQIEGATSDEIIERLFAAGLVNLRACERQAAREEVARQQEAGLPRCEAMHATAELFCCSYEKIRNYFYGHS